MKGTVNEGEKGVARCSVGGVLDKGILKVRFSRISPG